MLFRGRYNLYKPSFKFVDWSRVKDLFNLGVKFFFVQIASILLYQTNNIIISQLFGPEMVTPYNVAFRYFSVLMMGFSIIVAPLWSAFTEAWVKQEIYWIKNTMNKLIKIWFLFLVLGIALLYSSNVIYNFWIGNTLKIPLEISVLVFIWVLINIWNGIFSQFLNGIGKIKLQLIIGILSGLINIPLALVLGKVIGISGILLSNIFVLIFSCYIYPLQYYKIINFKAHGIWAK